MPHCACLLVFSCNLFLVPYSTPIRFSIPSKPLFLDPPPSGPSFLPHRKPALVEPPHPPTLTLHAPRPPPEFVTGLAQNRRRSIPQTFQNTAFSHPLLHAQSAGEPHVCWQMLLFLPCPPSSSCRDPSTSQSGLGHGSHLPCGCLLRIVPSLCWRRKGYMTLPNLASDRTHLLLL